MDNEKNNENCKQVEEKLVCLLNDNGSLLQMIRELKAENERLRSELKRARTGLPPDRTGADNNNAEVQSLIEINHGWKRDYEELQMRYEMLSGEKKLLEEEQELKEWVDELEWRQGLLEGEIARLAGALCGQNSGGHCGGQNGSHYNEECDVLKTQIMVYREDFECERSDRENIHEEKEKLKQELDGAEEIIQKLTTELDACKARAVVERMHIRPEEAYVSLRERSDLRPRHQEQLIMTERYSPVVPL